MARLITSGFEQQVIDTAVASRAEGQGYIASGAPTIETTVVRSGAASLKVTGATNYVRWANVGQTLARNYYWRFYLRFPTAPSVNAVIARVYDSIDANLICSVRLSTGRLIALLNAAGTNIGSSSAALAVDTWHRIEVRVKVPASGNGELELHVNDTQVANNTSTNVGNTAPSGWLLGQFSGTVASLYFEDVALNDDQGSDQNARPGSGKIVLLKPIADQSRTGWTDGNGGTSNLYQAVDNAPPVGEATSGTTATSQVEDANNNATDTYVANLETYTTGGLASTDVVVLTQALATVGNSATDLRDAGLQQSSNPSGSEAIGISPSVAASTYPVGWNTFRDAVLYWPSVTLGSSPQLTLRKAEASTDVLACAALGLYVEFKPAILPPAGAATAAATAPTAQITATSPASDSTASSSAPTPQVSVTAPAASTTAAVSAPVVSVSDTDTAPAAQATASASAPTITVTDSDAPPAAEATASAPVPTPVISLAAPVAEATADALSPSVVVGELVVGVPAEAAAVFLVPALTITGDRTIAAPAAEATASFSAPTIPGTAVVTSEGGWVRPRTWRKPVKHVLVLARAAEAYAEFPTPTVTHFMDPAMQREEEFVLSLI